MKSRKSRFFVFETDGDNEPELIAQFKIGFDAQLFVNALKDALPKEGKRAKTFHVEVGPYDKGWD